MNFLKLLAIAFLAIHLASAEEPGGASSPTVPPTIDGGKEWPAGLERRLERDLEQYPGSVLDPPADGTGYRFSLATEPRPENWSLLLGALLSIGFIVRRRLAAG